MQTPARLPNLRRVVRIPAATGSPTRSKICKAYKRRRGQSFGNRPSNERGFAIRRFLQTGCIAKQPSAAAVVPENGTLFVLEVCRQSLIRRLLQAGHTPHPRHGGFDHRARPGWLLHTADPLRIRDWVESSSPNIHPASNQGPSELPHSDGPFFLRP